MSSWSVWARWGAPPRFTSRGAAKASRAGSFHATAFVRLFARADAHHPGGVLRASDVCAARARAYELWTELERLSGRDLMRITGGLMMAGPTACW